MVKSYRGVPQAKSGPELQSIKAEDYMTRQLVVFSPDDDMPHVIRTLILKKISGGPVVDAEGKLVGIISEGDCLKEVVMGKYTNTPTMLGKVSEHMTRNVIHIAPDMNIFDLAKMFLEKKLRRFPVLHNDKLVGQISQRDVMRAVENFKDTTWK